MNSRISIVAIAISLALSGCATTGVEQTGRPVECNVHQPVCPIVPVTVVPDPVVGCKVTMAGDVDVSGPDHHIFWELNATSPYTFAPNDGIFIKPNSNPADQFSPSEPGQSGKKFGLRDKNSVHGTYSYPYGIKVMDGSTACAVFDPTIINRG
ncbi:MAG: hypothetical protein KGJ25_07315 [Betaproteobacteria bacterium]|nr:hypothetical protein [Betaproteobacteria bacterium]MDE2003324.1 hypothetical protein [Betaproteobacteria bacterium]